MLRRAARTARDRVRSVGIAAVVALAGCRTPATYVTVVVDTDAPNRVLSMHAITSRGSSVSAHADSHTWSRSGSADEFNLPSSFSVVPGDGPSDGTVTLQVELVFAPSSTDQPIVTARRTARFRFVPHEQNYIRLFIPVSCGALVVPPAGCTDASTPCTVSRYCEEQSNGATCGDDGRCVTVDVMPMPLPHDAGLSTDAVDADAAVDTGIAPLDAPADDATIPADAPIDAPGADAPPVDACSPSCAGHDCGPDGCGGSCGTCAASQRCDPSGRCVCVPNCAGRMCGDDGCGGSCGTCGSGTCNGAGQCVAVCTPDCMGHVCGNDGCSGSCGTCGSGQTCDALGRCVCAPDCVGRACGPDSCGGSCGSCGSGQVCNGAGSCIACSTGAPCDPGDPCATGSIDCSTGTPRCLASGFAAAGTACGGGVCNGSGTCVACAQGASCAPANECIMTATIECSSGSPVCTARTFAPSGTLCFSPYDGSVCDGSGGCGCVHVAPNCMRCGACNYSCVAPC